MTTKRDGDPHIRCAKCPEYTEQSAHAYVSHSKLAKKISAVSVRVGVRKNICHKHRKDVLLK
jgi:hypothetical protein